MPFTPSRAILAALLALNAAVGAGQADAGEWRRIAGNKEVLSLAVDPRGTGSVVVALNYSEGTLRSTDGGAHFAARPADPNPEGPGVVRLLDTIRDPAAPGGFFASGQATEGSNAHGSLWWTGDSGANWRLLGYTPSVLYTGLAISGGWLVAPDLWREIDATRWTFRRLRADVSRGPGGFTLVPTDDTMQSSPYVQMPRGSITAPDGTIYRWGGLGLHVSFDHAESFAPLPNEGQGPVDQFSIPNTAVTAFEIDPTNPKVLLAGNSEGVWRSVNGGKTFHRSNTGLPTSERWSHCHGVAWLAHDPLHPGAVYAGVALNSEVDPNRGVYLSEDFGITWRRVGGFPAFAQNDRVVASPAHPGSLLTGLIGVWEFTPTDTTRTYNGPPATATTIIRGATPQGGATAAVTAVAGPPVRVVLWPLGRNATRGYTFTVRVGAGQRAAVRIPARLEGRRLAPGRYRLATSAGQRGIVRLRVSR